MRAELEALREKLDLIASNWAAEPREVAAEALELLDVYLNQDVTAMTPEEIEALPPDVGLLRSHLHQAARTIRFLEREAAQDKRLIDGLLGAVEDVTAAGDGDE